MVPFQGSSGTRIENPDLSSSRAQSLNCLAMPADSWDTKKRGAYAQELGQAPLIPAFFTVKYRYGLHLVFVGYQ